MCPFCFLFVFYITKPQAKYTLTRDEIQGRLAALDDIRRTLCVDDMGLRHSDAEVVIWFSSAYKGTPEDQSAAKKHT